MQQLDSEVVLDPDNSCSVLKRISIPINKELEWWYLDTVLILANTNPIHRLQYIGSPGTKYAIPALRAMKILLHQVWSI